VHVKTTVSGAQPLVTLLVKQKAGHCAKEVELKMRRKNIAEAMME
jgi:hypothetical protein